jgi:uncharacterized protein
MSRNPFLVQVTNLRRSLANREEVTRRGAISSLRVLGSLVPSDSEIEVRVILESVDGGVVATGTVKAPWLGECRRCLDVVEGDLEIEVRELFEVRDGRWAPDEADEETYALVGEHVDLAELARDAVLLNLPLAPLCRPDCAGLCPNCGADRNFELCDCEEMDGDGRWEGIDVLRRSELS